MPRRGYHFFHVNSSGKLTDFCDNNLTSIPNDELAIYTALQSARRMYDDGLHSGTLKCEGYWDARGFKHEVSLADVPNLHHPFDEIPDVIFDARVVFEIMDELWPRNDDSWQAPHLFSFKIRGVVVTLLRPGANMIELGKDGVRVTDYPGSPRLFTLVTQLGVDKEEADLLWNALVERMQELRSRYAKCTAV